MDLNIKENKKKKKLKINIKYVLIPILMKKDIISVQKNIAIKLLYNSVTRISVKFVAMISSQEHKPLHYQNAKKIVFKTLLSKKNLLIPLIHNVYRVNI